MLTLGSVSREEAAKTFEFLAQSVKGRRAMIKEFTHTQPDFVFWIYPDGRLMDARDAHRENYPKGYKHILNDEPHYGGFLRGRLATRDGKQLIVLYCVPAALESDVGKIEQFLTGMSDCPVPLDDNVLVVSDNGDIYGTITDVEMRLQDLG